MRKKKWVDVSSVGTRFVLADAIVRVDFDDEDYEVTFTILNGENKQYDADVYFYDDKIPAGVQYNKYKKYVKKQLGL